METFALIVDFLGEPCGLSLESLVYPWPGKGLGEASMARVRPFLFCRYQFTVDEEVLNTAGQFALLKDLQGQPIDAPAAGISERYLDSIIMRPRKIKWRGYDVLTWTVGHEIEERVRATYDPEQDKLDFDEIKDGSVRFSDFVAVPNLGVLAVDDRAGDLHLGGKQAINRFRAVIRMSKGADVAIVFDATPDEVRRALTSWKLTSFKFTIRPNNPRPVSRLAEALGDQLKKDFIGSMTGTAKPEPGDHMRMGDGGFINATTDLIDAGYGQSAVAGTTPDGLEAEIKKPRFDLDPDKNEKIQGKPRQLRIYIDSEDMTDEQVFATAAGSLIRFYSDAD